MRFLQTRKGYAFFEVSSAFQKAIRRGEENEALYWAIELFLSGYDEYAWKRMIVMVSEDVGLAEPGAPAIMAGLHHNYIFLKKKADGKKMPHKLPYVHAVCYLSRIRKSRLIDWKVVAMFKEHDSIKKDIPDYAFDQHTAKGKRMGRGLDHFFTEGTKLHNMATISGEEQAKEKAYQVLTKTPNTELFPDGDE